MLNTKLKYLNWYYSKTIFQLNINIYLKVLSQKFWNGSRYHHAWKSILSICVILDRNDETLYETSMSLFFSLDLSNVFLRKWKYGLRASSLALEPASQLNLPETQYLLFVRKTHGFVESSGAHCERSCTLLPRVREREMHNSQFARRQARYYFPRIRYRVFRHKMFARMLLLISFAEFLSVRYIFRKFCMWKIIRILL